jgi:N-acetylated-alpha-linked acidic dipeptidase
VKPILANVALKSLSKKFPAKILDEVSGEEMWKHIEDLSRIDRVSGTPGEREGLEYICRILKSYGIRPEVHEFNAYISIPGKTQLEVVSPERKEIHAITHSFAVSTPPAGVEAELAYVKPWEGGDNPLLSTVDAGNYQQANVKSKIALVDGTASPTKVYAAQNAGALAQIHISTEPIPHEMIVTTIWGTPTPSSATRIPKIHVASVGKEDGTHLKDLCKKGPVKVRLKAEVSTEWRKIAIPVATIKGSDEPEKFVLVGGHYCAWYVGVTDNATGDVSLLEIARIAHKNRKALKRTAKVAWWPGHSQGRYAGSTWYADSEFDELNSNAIAYVNIDSPGSKGATMYDLEAMPEALDYATNVASSLTKMKIQQLRPGRWGDQSFWGIGFPSVDCYSMAENNKRAVVGGSGGGWWWHTPEDTLDKADLENQVRDTRVNLALVLGLCNSDVLPWDFSKTADQYVHSLMDLDTKADTAFDLKPLVTKAMTLRTSTSTLKKAASRITGLRGRKVAVKIQELNDTYMKLSRVLVPVLFTQSGRYDQDPAADAPFLPGLQGIQKLGSSELSANERGFLLTQLTRERNRLSDALDQAITLTERCLRALKA